MDNREQSATFQIILTQRKTGVIRPSYNDQESIYLSVFAAEDTLIPAITTVDVDSGYSVSLGMLQKTSGSMPKMLDAMCVDFQIIPEDYSNSGLLWIPNKPVFYSRGGKPAEAQLKITFRNITGVPYTIGKDNLIARIALINFLYSSLKAS